LIQLSNFLQQQSKIIVSDQFEILESVKDSEYQIFKLCLPYVNVNSLILSLNTSIDIFNNPLNIKEEINKLNLLSYSEPGQNQQHFLKLANLMDIPYLKIDDGIHIMGTGIFSKKIGSTRTDNTSSIGLQLVKNKITSSAILNKFGIPGSIMIQVENEIDLLNAAIQIGYPVVIKPIDRDNGDGVFSNIIDNETLLELYKKSLLFSKNIAVEKHFEGVGHRITIYDKKILTVTKKIPFGITGDGISNIDSLIKDKDYEAIGLIKQYNLELNTVLEKGKFIPLKRRNNASAGGATIGLDIDSVHQDNINLCLKVADIFSLNMVGVDLIIPDISKSWMEVGCLVCDVNGIPQIGYEYVAKPIMEDLFKLGSRIPAYLLIVNSLENLDISTIINITKCDGISSANGIWVNNKLISNNFNNGFEAAIALLFDRNINRALCILTDKGISQFGLPLDKFDGIFIQKDILKIEMVSQILKNSKNIIEI